MLRPYKEAEPGADASVMLVVQDEENLTCLKTRTMLEKEFGLSRVVTSVS